MTEEVVDKRVKEKQVKVLRDLVTVNRESEPKVPLGNREGGRAKKRSQDISPDGMFPIKTLLF